MKNNYKQLLSLWKQKDLVALYQYTVEQDRPLERVSLELLTRSLDLSKSPRSVRMEAVINKQSPLPTITSDATTMGNVLAHHENLGALAGVDQAQKNFTKSEEKMWQLVETVVEELSYQQYSELQVSYVQQFCRVWCRIYEKIRYIDILPVNEGQNWTLNYRLVQIENNLQKVVEEGKIRNRIMTSKAKRIADYLVFNTTVTK